jgi:ketosteroid isomerase-like protein
MLSAMLPSSGKPSLASATASERAAAWLLDMQRCVRSRDYRAARELFALDVQAFGTHSPAMHGLDALEREQWRQVWPCICGFTYRLDTLCVWSRGDGLYLSVEWDSEGVRDDGGRFNRPGRATLGLAERDGELVAVHSHFSLARAGTG